MFVICINDCSDPNAQGRQGAKVGALFGVAPTFVPVSSDLEAAGNLVDVLDATEGKPGVILVNVAPRHGAAKKWPNGTPFGYFYVGETLVIASIDGLTLSLVKKLGLVATIHVFDIPIVMAEAVRQGWVTEARAEAVINTQFRSLEFVPQAAAWVLAGNQLPTTPMSVVEVPDAPLVVWCKDNFGNCKTTLLPGELSAVTRKNLFGVPLHARLADVPNGKTSFTVGSSGYGPHRFVEIVVQGGSAATRLRFRSGTVIGA